MVTRLQLGQVNTVLACIIDSRVRLMLPQWEQIQGTCIVINLYDYLSSQSIGNFHKYLKDPFVHKVGGEYSVPTSEFYKARQYLEAICRDTSLKADKKYREAFQHCFKIFVIEMLTVQLVLYQLEKLTDAEATRVLCTLPEIFIKQEGLKPFDGDINSLLSMQGQVVLVKDFDSIFEHLTQEDISHVFECILGLGLHVMHNIDFNSLLSTSLTAPGPLLKQTISQIWLVMQDIYAVGGETDESLKYL